MLVFFFVPFSLHALEAINRSIIAAHICSDVFWPHEHPMKFYTTSIIRFFFFPRHQWHCLCATMNDFRTENITNVIYQQIWTLILLLCYAWDESETNVYHLINYRPITRAVLFCDSCERTQKPEKEKLFKFQSCKFLIWFFFFELWLFVCPLIPDVDKSNNKRCMRHWTISWNLRCWFSFFAHSLLYSIKPMRLATASQLHFGDACAFSVLRQF